MTKPEDTLIGDAIAAMRAEGYNPELEAVLAERWLCPHCGHETPFTGILIPIGEGSADHDPACPKCEMEGIEPMPKGAPELTVIGGGKTA